MKNLPPSDSAPSRQPSAEELQLLALDLSPERQDMLERTAQEARDLAYYPSFCCCVALPPSKQEGTLYERISGPYKLNILSPPCYGIPYGIAPRQIIAAITTYVTQRKTNGEDTRKVYLGRSFSDMVKTMTGVEDAALGGGKRGKLTQYRRQFPALVTSRILWWQNRFSGNMPVPYDIASNWLEQQPLPPEIEKHVLWKAHQEEIDAPFNFRTTLTLGEYFHRDILEHSPVIRGGIFRLLAKTGACLPLDIYVWLTYRAATLGKHHRDSLTISWELLKMQFGSNYESNKVGMRNFKAKFLEAFARVQKLYPEASISVGSSAVQFTLTNTSVSKQVQGTGTDDAAGLQPPPAEQAPLFEGVSEKGSRKRQDLIARKDTGLAR